GVTLEVFFGDPEQEMLPLTELLTVHGERNGKVNVNTAPLEVLDAYGQVTGQGGLAQMIVEERETTPFLSSEDLVLRGVAPAEDQQDVQPSVLVVKSRSFRIRGHGLAGKSKVRIDAYMWRDERQPSEPLRILDWRVMR
ncbi:MAG: general secretion pathway protein GspK, partial [bacterium]|nr:general secretion pathway protein GspK [bacterium]